MCQLESIEKQSLMKVAVDLVKADNRIHRNEVAALGRLQKMYFVSNEEMEMTHYMSLQQAVERLSQLPTQIKEELLKHLDDIVSVDNDEAQEVMREADCFVMVSGLTEKKFIKKQSLVLQLANMTFGQVQM